MEIVLENFILVKIDRTNDVHNLFIKKIDLDSDIKKYLYPYNRNFDDYLDARVSGIDIFNNTFIIFYQERIIGYIEIEGFKNVKFNYAILKEERGKGLGALLIRELSNHILSNYPDILSVNTIIRDENIASIKTSINSGFDYIESKNGFTTYGRKR